MRTKRITTIFLTLIFMLGVYGCAHMSQFQMAKRISLTTYRALKLAKAEIQEMQNSVLPEMQKAAQEAIPIYNEAYDLLKKYNQMLLQWQKTNQKPADIDVVSQELNLILNHLNRIILQHLHKPIIQDEHSEES